MPAVPQTLKTGSRGAGVQFLQQRLSQKNARQPLAQDGIFGKKTRAAVCAFQKACGLRADGIAGPQTWDRLLHPAVYYRQGDARWGALPYTSTGNTRQSIASSGCGPAAMAMLISALGRQAVLPPQLCRFAVDRGHRTANHGTGWGFFPDAAQQYGLGCRQTASFAEVERALAAGGGCIANMGPGMFTKTGHYIALRDQNPFDGEVYVMDPASASRVRASRQILMQQSKTFFILFRHLAA